MDFKQIQELIKMINKSNIGEVSIEEKEFKITIKQKKENVTQVLSAAPAQYALPQTVQPAAIPASPAAAPSLSSLPSSAASASEKIGRAHV